MAITIKRTRPSRYSKSIFGTRAELTFVITGLPAGTTEDQVRQLAEPVAPNPDQLPDTVTPYAGVPYYADDVRIDSVDAVGDNPGAVAIFRVIYSDRPEVFWSGPGVQNVSYGRSSVSIEQVPVWERVQNPEGLDTWNLRYLPYERRVTHRIYQGIVSVTLAQAQDQFENNLQKVRQFGAWDFLFAGFEVGETIQNQVHAKIEFIRNAKIKAFPVGTVLNDVAIPEIGPLDRYATRGVDFPFVGPPSPPQVIKVDSTELYEPWVPFTFDVDGVS